MKKIYLILIVVLLALQLKAQLVYDETGSIVRFSKVEKYKEIIEKHKLETYYIPWMDNDSLCRKYNKGKSIDELGSEYIGAIYTNVIPFDLKKIGTEITLKHGTIWRYAIKGVSAKTIGIAINLPKLRQGSYLAIIATDTTHFFTQPPRVYSLGNIPDHVLRDNTLTQSVFGKEMIIEYFVPNGESMPEKVFIEDISYGFVGVGRKNVAVDKRGNLKSGVWGSSEYSTCQHDVACTDIGNYQNEAKSVVFLRAEYRIDKNDNGCYDHHKIISMSIWTNC